MSHFDPPPCFCRVTYKLDYECPKPCPTLHRWDRFLSETFSHRLPIARRISEVVSEFDEWREANGRFYDDLLNLRRDIQPLEEPYSIDQKEDPGAPQLWSSSYSSLPCHLENCCLWLNHTGEHELIQMCEQPGCSRHKGHILSHDTRTESLVLDDHVKAVTGNSLNDLTQLVLAWMKLGPYLDTDIFSGAKLKLATQSMRNTPQKMVMNSLSEPRTYIPSCYSRIDFNSEEIRLFRLLPTVPGMPLLGSFVSCRISECPRYIALSYTWGDQSIKRSVSFDNGGKIAISDNLWQFLQLQNATLTDPTYFWIDAICIDQGNLQERNHQVGMMKAIYAQANEVYVWLGPEEDDSDLGMRFLVQQSNSPLRVRGSGYFPIWSRREAKALSALCERPYWRRMWIIQELLHARKITVWCGTKHFDWSDIEVLYLKLETIQDTHWFAHHEFFMPIKQSAATTMIWQRAHWRHPKTPPPRLSRLIEIFRDWHCTDIRDKVFALVGMATPESAIIPDYALTTREIYFAVMSKVTRDKENFANLLSQLLGVAGKDVELWEQSLVEYNVHPLDRMVLHSRLCNNWN